MERSARFSSNSKVNRTFDHSSDDKMSSNGRLRRENHKILKQKSHKSDSDSSSRASRRSTLEQRLASDLNRSSSVLPAGNLVKISSANEMSEETESRRRSPNVIAKLMGLDRVPSQHGGSRQPKRPSDSLNRKTVSSGTCRHRQSCNNQSCRKIANEQLFKDIYEVRESSVGLTGGYTFQVSPNRKHKEYEMAFVKQKFKDAKRLSIDEKLQGSKEFHDTIDALSSNNHLFLKALQEPDLLYAKHLHDLHASLPSHRGNIQNLKAPSVLDYNINTIGHNSGRGASTKIDISLSRDCRKGERGHLPHKHAHVSDKSSNLLCNGKEATNTVPKKIVLLKPNHGRTHRTAKSFSSSSSPHELWADDVDVHNKKQMDVRHGESELSGKKRSPINLDFSVHKCQETRELAEEITQQMKSKLGEVSFNVPLSGYRRFSADESSHDMSGNDSSYESDTTFLTPQTRHRTSYQGRSSSSHYAGSSVTREGKKRLSERWKMTHRSMEIRMDKGTTLGEMLSMPDMDREMAENGSSGRSDNVSMAESVKPLGISSRDGCRSLLEFMSQSSTSDHIKTPQGCIKNEVLDTERLLISKEAAGHGRKKAIYRDLNRKEVSSGNRRCQDKKRCSSHHMSEVNDEQVGGSGKKSVLEEESPKLKTMIMETPTCLLDTTSNLGLIMNSEHEHFPVPLNSSDDLLPAASFSNEVQVKDQIHSNGTQECTQDPVAQPESPISSKETDQPSPVSVLGPPFSEDLSLGSDSFGRVSSDLHGLRMQLQLLKLEYKATSEVEKTRLISSNDNENSPTGFGLKDPPSYIADVLAELGFQDTDPNILMTTWNSSEYPAGPWIFEKLEKKYNGPDMDCSRPNRKLLFDRIRCGITEIVQRSTNPYPWVKTRPRLHISKAWLEAELKKVLVDQEKTEKGTEELQSESQWMEVEMYVDGVGRELGKMVLDELILESLVM